MRQSQSGFVDPSRVSGFAPASDAEFDRAISFRFIVTWSSLLQWTDTPRPVPQALPLVPAPRLMPPPTQVMPLSTSAQTYADEVAPSTIKKSRSAPGFQWEMVVPKMVRTAKKTPAPTSPRPAPPDRAFTSEPASAETSAPNLYTAASGFRKSFSFKLCVGVGVLAVISVPLWKHAARAAPSEIETSVAGGDWMRESAIAGDPGVKQSRQLVLYKPALKAGNCRFEFDWTTASGDVGLIFRAKDLGNYYAVRLKVLKAGPNPSLSAEYFSVYQFVEHPHNEKIVVFSRNDPVVHVRMDVFGPMFTLYLQNNATEYWTDAQLASGAVGFLEEWNRSAEVHGVRMSFPQHSQLLHAPGARDEASGGD